MGLLRRLFDSAYRRARQAEGAGDYRRAAALYAEAGAPEEAAHALLFHAARSSDLEERVRAWQDALRWLGQGHPRRAEVEARMGQAVLEDAQRHGALGPTESRRLEDAASRLERVGRYAEAATAWELLSRPEAAARCLERAGEVERLEGLLGRLDARDARARDLRRLLADHEMAVRVGARLEALAALRRAAQVAPDDPDVAALLRELEGRLPPPGRVGLESDGRRALLVGKVPCVLGRGEEADVALRGASVSRRHAELDRRPDGLVVRDLGSRNGTLVAGVPIAGELVASGSTVVGLGEDVTLGVDLGSDGLRLEVVHGVDRGLEVWVGRGPLRPLDLRASIQFPQGRATLTADRGVELQLGTQRCVAPVVLLAGDILHLEGRRLEVTR